MSETNGNGTAPEVKRVLSLETARATKTRKGNDFITVQQAHDMVIQECAKVHGWYMAQFPNYMATFIQDALVTYGLIVVPPVVASESSETPSGDTPPADSIPPAEPAA